MGGLLDTGDHPGEDVFGLLEELHVVDENDAETCDVDGVRTSVLKQAVLDIAVRFAVRDDLFHFSGLFTETGQDAFDRFLHVEKVIDACGKRCLVAPSKIAETGVLRIIDAVEKTSTSVDLRLLRKTRIEGLEEKGLVGVDCHAGCRFGRSVFRFQMSVHDRPKTVKFVFCHTERNDFVGAQRNSWRNVVDNAFGVIEVAFEELGDKPDGRSNNPKDETRGVVDGLDNRLGDGEDIRFHTGKRSLDILSECFRVLEFRDGLLEIQESEILVQLQL